jgi:hydroxyacylglutathione hydrolase
MRLAGSSMPGIALSPNPPENRCEAEVIPYLLHCQWFLDYSRVMFGREPEAFVQPLLDEMLRSRAADWRDGRLVALAPHTPPPPGWLVGKVMPGNWPKVNA